MTRFPGRIPIGRRDVIYPDIVTINTIFACDLNCVGCGRACFVPPLGRPPITLDRVQQIFDEAASLHIRIRQARIGGGEPTLHPHFVAIVRLCAANSDLVRINSNQYSAHAREQLAQVQGLANIRIIARSAKRDGDRTFVNNARVRGIWIDPVDAGVECPWPCKKFFARGCGVGTDQVGYSLCPAAGTIDHFLGLSARATTLAQMADRDFVIRQAATICRHCGQNIRFQTPPQTWEHTGSLMSRSYHERICSLQTA